MGLVVLFWHR